MTNDLAVEHNGAQCISHQRGADIRPYFLEPPGRRDAAANERVFNLVGIISGDER